MIGRVCPPEPALWGAGEGDPQPALRGAGEGVASMNEDSEALLAATPWPVGVDVETKSLPYGFSETCRGLWGPPADRSKKVWL